ncbi:zinc finger protein 704 [Magallana gigas]|uniref:zinc finger protein 704 n=1 Tax=Magallana gigas TaxID=29159 RepID=UPI00333F4566
MSGNRRLAKRSIVGTKVCALWKDGRFYPGVITDHSGELSIADEQKYTVVFDDGFQKSVYARHIIGHGFQQINSFRLKHGQKVFLTAHGREVSGVVVRHDTDSDQVVVNVKLTGGEGVDLEVRSEDLRLLESRKSARLVDQDTDYSKLADISVAESKKRPVSTVIDVPNVRAQRYRRSSSDQEDDDVKGDDVEMMDETIAAMVLTSLSCSPASPQFHGSFTEHGFKSTTLSTSANSSGFHSERSDPSPPSHHLSGSAPAEFVVGSFHKDDGIDIEDFEDETIDVDTVEPKRKRQTHLRLRYQCTFPGCSLVTDTCASIEKHVRTAHLGGSESDDSRSDGEEEFYYTEIEVNVDNVTQKFSQMCTSSPPEVVGPLSPSIPVPDHDYQKKDHNTKFQASSVPSSGFFHQGITPMSFSNPPQMKRSMSWQSSAHVSSPPTHSLSPPIRVTKPTPQERLHQHQAQSPKSHLYSVSPKTTGFHKKPRSEVRKCRKVYGMENRDQWCTQCKWKKACSRFVD